MHGQPATFRVVAGCLMTVLVVLPLPFGGARPWAASLYILLLGLLLLPVALRGLLLTPDLPVAWRRIRMEALLLGAVIAVMVVQITPWTPEAWHAAVWRAADAALRGTGEGGRVTLEPALTADAMLRLLAYAATFWLALQCGRSGRTARRMIAAIVACGAAYAGYGLVVTISGARTILWFDKWVYLDDLTSTF
ncbi:MAG TPA: hypothetical protein VGC92_14965, partial [Phenylobacterium sp.]